MVWHTWADSTGLWRSAEKCHMLELAPMAEQNWEQSKTGSRVIEQGRNGLGGDLSAEFSCLRNIYCTAYQHVSISAYQHAAYSQCCRALLRMMSKKEEEMNGEHTWRHLCKWEQLVRSKTDQRNAKREQSRSKRRMVEQSWPTGDNWH